MQLVSQQTPSPRILVTVVPELREKPPERVSIRSRLKSSPLFTGNGRAIFLGLILGALLICGISVFYVRHKAAQEAAQQRAEQERKLLAVSTKSVSVPEPVMIRISPDLIHVSAISLGHPRLAIINGRSVAEGETVTIHASAGAVSLRVTRIADGAIELSDGAQVIKARLELAAAPRPKS